MGFLGRIGVCGVLSVGLLLGAPAAHTASFAEEDKPKTSDSGPTTADWMNQPDAASLLERMTEAQADFEKAHKVQVKADKQVAALSVEINAQQAAVDAATLRIQRYARDAYIGLADTDNLEAFSTIFASEGMNALTQSKTILDIVGATQAQQIAADNTTLQGVETLRQQQEQIRQDAEKTKKAAEDRGNEILSELGTMLGTSADLTVESTTPTTCPKKVPAGSLMGGAAEIGAEKLCKQSVKEARSPAAAAAIVWAFNHLGKPYNSGGVPIDNEQFGSFNCATFVAMAYYWGARNVGFLGLPWTPAYASPSPFLKPIGDKYQAGDINIMWRSGDMASSGGAAGHAQLFLADGWLIQSGGTGRVTNVTNYPNGWGGWQETHFAVVNPGES